MSELVYWLISFLFLICGLYLIAYKDIGEYLFGTETEIKSILSSFFWLILSIVWPIAIVFVFIVFFDKKFMRSKE